MATPPFEHLTLLNSTSPQDIWKKYNLWLIDTAPRKAHLSFLLSIKY